MRSPRMRVSMRWALMAIAALGVGLGSVVKNARRQRAAVAAIEAAGGYVYYDFQGGNNVFAEHPRGPDWLWRHIDLSYTSDVNTVFLYEKQLGEETIFRLGQLSNPTSVHLWDTNISDANMQQISKLKKLESINLDNTKVTDEGLAKLKHLKSLRARGTAVTTKGAEHLARLLPELTIIYGNDWDAFLQRGSPPGDGKRRRIDITQESVRGDIGE